MRIDIDYDQCIASGVCVLACPEVFTQNDDGIVELLVTEVPDNLLDKVLDATRACPAACIQV